MLWQSLVRVRLPHFEPWPLDNGRHDEICLDGDTRLYSSSFDFISRFEFDGPCSLILSWMTCSFLALCTNPTSTIRSSSPTCTRLAKRVCKSDHGMQACHLSPIGPNDSHLGRTINTPIMGAPAF